MKFIYSLLLLLSFFSVAHANEVDAVFKNGNVEAGQKLFLNKNPNGSFDSCSTCHTDNLKNMGKHVKTNKEIKPFAPSANPERFTDLNKVEKWFKRNCNDVFSRECTTKEKSDIVAYAKSVK